MFQTSRHLAILLTIILFLTKCGSAIHPSDSEDISNKNDAAQNDFIVVPNELIHEQSIDSLFTPRLFQELKAVYEKSNHTAYWHSSLGLNDNGIAVIALFEKASSYGLNKDFYRINDNQQSLAEMDIQISRNFLLFAHHHIFGIIPFERSSQSYNPINTPLDTLPLSLLFAENPVQALFHLSDSLHPSPEYKNLLTALDHYCNNTHLTIETLKVPIAKTDSIKSYEMAKKALLLHGYIDSNATSMELMEGLQIFQLHNGLEPDGKIGKYTAQALSKSTYECWLQAALTLQKWRWEKDWPLDVFYVNIPAYTLRVYENNQLKQEHRVVVGTSWTPSPTLNSKLEYFILNPEWYVPSSITQGELIPKMQKDPTYLKRNNYSLVSKDGKSLEDIDWSTANSSNFKYTIKQGKGSSNALGLVKFIFNNPYSVYLHDTPSKSFFEKDIRSYSHGCIRVQNPFQLVEYILTREKGAFTMDDVSTILANKTQKTITPKLVYPIRIRYMCSTATPNNELITHLDIYKKESVLLEILKPLLPCP